MASYSEQFIQNSILSFDGGCVLVTVSVLIVDDSGFFRKRLHEILSKVPEIKVVGAASNGREALDLVKKLKPDVITMDYEMPIMDGVTAVRHIMSECPTPILMFSSLKIKVSSVNILRRFCHT